MLNSESTNIQEEEEDIKQQLRFFRKAQNINILTVTESVSASGSAFGGT